MCFFGSNGFKSLTIEERMVENVIFRKFSRCLLPQRHLAICYLKRVPEITFSVYFRKRCRRQNCALAAVGAQCRRIRVYKNASEKQSRTATAISRLPPGTKMAPTPGLGKDFQFSGYAFFGFAAVSSLWYIPEGTRTNSGANGNRLAEPQPWKS